LILTLLLSRVEHIFCLFELVAGVLELSSPSRFFKSAIVQTPPAARTILNNLSLLLCLCLVRFMFSGMLRPVLTNEDAVLVPRSEDVGLEPLNLERCTL
jgi:hypothetical protein